MTLATCSAAQLNVQPSGSLLSLEDFFRTHQPQIEQWFRTAFQATPPVLTTSVDLRHEGHRLAPVDTNLFPAGFNNLNPEFMPLYIQAVQSAILTAMPCCTRILIIPENHTRNRFYFESLSVLCEILSKAGFDIRLGSLLEDLKEPIIMEFEESSYPALTLLPVMREDKRLKVADFDPCMILLNNDLSTGIPEIFQGITQTFLPHPDLGWAKRLKSTHFTHYHNVATEFSAALNIDPWFISPLFRACHEVSFMDGVGMGLLAQHVSELLGEIRAKYQHYGITQEPFVVIKADAGTYGMGILMVKSAEEVLSLNRKNRTKMSTSKGNQKIEQVIIQEGIYSFETAGTPPNEGVAEPVIYLLGQYAIGGFYRIHKDKKYDENLNAPGMHFEPLAFNAACNNPQVSEAKPTPCANRFYAYGVIARLAALAAAHEARDITQ